MASWPYYVNPLKLSCHMWRGAGFVRLGGLIELDEAVSSLGPRLVNLARPEDPDDTWKSRRRVLVMGLKYNNTYRFGICLIDAASASGTHEHRVQVVPSREPPTEQPQTSIRVCRPGNKMKVAAIHRAFEVALTWFRSTPRPGASSPGAGVGDPTPADQHTTVLMGDFGITLRSFANMGEGLTASLSRELGTTLLQLCGCMRFPSGSALAPHPGCIARVRVVYSV